MNFKVGDILTCKEDINQNFSNDIFIKYSEYNISRVLDDVQKILIVNTYNFSSYWFSFSMAQECFYTTSDIRKIKLEKLNYENR